MTQSKLDKLIEAKLKKRDESDRYHKRTQLLEVKPSLKRMIAENLSIKEQVELLDQAGIKISDKSYREFLSREFGAVYDDFLVRNGWVRKKRKEKDG